MIEFASLLSLWLQFVAITVSTYMPCELCTDRATARQLANIELRLYPSESIDWYVNVSIGNAVELYDQINTTKPTVLYISGWTENPDSKSVVTILDAYLERQDHNILLADYEEIAAMIWDQAAASADGVGYTLAAALDELTATGVDSTSLHIVGHSLGAQVAGYVGRYTNFTVRRITGLDPAAPSFKVTDDHLSSDDAEFVDVIHTNAGIFGANYSAATVDFYPNGGSLQPGCGDHLQLTTHFCNHARSWIYYAESLLNEIAFLALKCDSYDSFQSGSCGSGTTVVMGYGTPTTTSGEFYLETNTESPFGKGEMNVKYQGE